MLQSLRQVQEHLCQAILQELIFNCTLVDQGKDINSHWPKVLRVEEEYKVTIILVVTMLHDQIPIDY